MKPPASAEILEFHDRAIAKGGQPPRAEALWQAIEANHRCNGVLWEQEDLARRRNVPDAEIAANKRTIDVTNQQRNDAIERIDEALLGLLEEIRPRGNARQHSETAGAMVDRLSILSLKLHHMRLQTERTDVERAHIEACRLRLKQLNEQRVDLAACFDRLLEEAARGESYFKVYRQHKMYNDPRLNPALYTEKKGGKKSGKR
jgi:Protein of unknown function (DUF4254)